MAERRSRHLRQKGRRGGSAILTVLLLAGCGGDGDTGDEMRTVSLRQGIEHGRLVASGGEPAGPENACFSCHGVNGEGDAGSGAPRLAGLDAHYIARQLNDYDQGSRPSDIMTPIARKLGRFDRQAVGVYYQYQAGAHLAELEP